MMNLRWKIAQVLEINWWKIYLNQQEVNDYLARKKLYWHKVLKMAAITLKKEDAILDVGCGPAGIFIILEQDHIDAADPLLEKYQLHLDHFDSEWYPNVNFQTTSLEAFRPEYQYDKIFCLNAINHVKDIQISIDRLSELLKKKGSLILSTDAHNFSFFKHLFRLIPGDMLHPHQYDIEEYTSMLTTRGFQIERIIRLKKGFFFDYHLILASK